jgi:hypothetical protein
LFVFLAALLINSGREYMHRLREHEPLEIEDRRLRVHEGIEVHRRLVEREALDIGVRRLRERLVKEEKHKIEILSVIRKILADLDLKEGFSGTYKALNPFSKITKLEI